MILFEFMRPLIDTHYQQLNPLTAAQQVHTQLVTFEQVYHQTPGSPAIDYSSPVAHTAYLYCYAGRHARSMAKVLGIARGQVVGNLLPAGGRRIVCLGGGPGTDLIGIHKFLAHNPQEGQQPLMVDVFDFEQGWAPVAAAAAQQVGPHVALASHPFDVRTQLDAQLAHSLAGADVVTMSYLLSEVIKFDGQGHVTSLLRDVFSRMKTGALFVFVDNKGDHTQYFDNIIAGQPLQLITGGQSFTKWGSDYEDVAALDGYKKLFNRSPLYAARVGYRVLRKV